MKQPDRFDKLVERYNRQKGYEALDNAAVDLLRNEHQAVVKLVEQQTRWTRAGGGDTVDMIRSVEGPWIDLDDLLAALATHTAGT